MKKVTIALVAAVLMSVSSVNAAAPEKPGMMNSIMGYGKKAVAGAKSMMTPPKASAAAPAAKQPGMFSKMASAVKAKMPGKK
jgi:hypothetical protein